MEFFFRLFDPSGFPPRWHCGSGWAESPWLGWLHVLSDLGVWGAYLAIPLVLMYFLWRRKDLPFRTIFLLFGGFILACGTTHLMEAIIFWWPVYRLAGLIKLCTALISWATVFSLFQVVPGVLTMRSPEELEREIAARKRAEIELQQANAELERRVAQRTLDLTLAADTLRDERELLHTTLRSIGDGVIVTDTQGRVTFLNELAEKLTGWTSQEARGLALDNVFHVVNESTRQPIDNPALMALQEGVTVGMANHSVLVSKEGIEFPVEDSAAPIRGDVGAVRGAVLVFRDVTERKKAELAIKHADQRKDEFLATLAHELRNPLAPIRNSLEVLKRSPDDTVVIEQSRLTMERQLGQMVRLVDDLIDVSRISRDRLELRCERVDIASIIRHAVEVGRPIADAARHEIEVSLPAKPACLYADSARLAQVFGNLLTNACKYTEPGGHIWITVEEVGGKVVTRMRDTGIGIPHGMLDQIFEMFVQVDRSLERTHSGLGIGLTLVKRLVEMHDGTVTAHSNGPGMGSEFVVTLPAITTAEPHDEPSANGAAPVASSPGTRRRILIADDNRDSAISLAMVLKLMGYETQTVFDGLSAVKAAESFHPDMVLLDIGMPQLNGYEACRRIRNQVAAGRPIIVAVTGWGQQDDRRRSTEAGFDHHLVKPLDPRELERLLAQLEVSAT
jgi:PAS domain S-box-containing protein